MATINWGEVDFEVGSEKVKGSDHCITLRINAKTLREMSNGAVMVGVLRLKAAPDAEMSDPEKGKWVPVFYLELNGGGI